MSLLYFVLGAFLWFLFGAAGAWAVLRFIGKKLQRHLAGEGKNDPCPLCTVTGYPAEPPKGES